MGESSKDRVADALAAMSGASTPSASQDVVPDDAMAAPPPDESVFAPKRRTTDLLAEQRLRAQRTAIPVLLTCGVLLPAIGALKWLAPADSVFAQWDLFMPLGLAAVGLLIIIVAAINMLQVRDALQRRSAAAAASAAAGLTRHGARS